MEIILSTFKYLIVFYFALFLFKLSEIKLRNSYIYEETFWYKISKNRIKAYILASIGIFTICIFASIRALDVGTDTSGYPIYYMQLAKYSNSFKEMLNTNSDFRYEPIGAFLVYFCSLFTDKSWLLLFFYQFFTILPVYIASLQFKDELSVTNSMCVYLFMFFNNSLNMMRQSVSCAFILLGLALIIKKKSIYKVIATLVFALLFHRSAVYGMILLFLTYFALSLRGKKNKYLICLLIIITPIVLPYIGKVVYNLTLDPHILYYIDVFIYGKVNVSWFVNPMSLYSLTYIIICFGYLLLLILFNTDFLKKVKVNNFISESQIILHIISSLNIVGFLIYVTILFSVKTMYGIRFSIFFDYIYIISIPLSVKYRKNYKLILHIVLVLFWFIWIIRMGWSGSQLYHIGL